MFITIFVIRIISAFITNQGLSKRLFLFVCIGFFVLPLKIWMYHIYLNENFFYKKGTSLMYWHTQEIINYLIDQLADKKNVF